MSFLGRMLFAGTATLIAGAGAAVLLLPGEHLESADHFEPAARTAPSVDPTPDRAADIGDVFAWVDGEDFNFVLTFAGPEPKDNPAVYDPDVLYRIHVSTDGEPVGSEHVIDFRFGLDPAGNVGIQAVGLPDGSTLEGPVEALLEDGDTRLVAGLFDDPFYFDSQGFRETRDTGTLSFDSTRDTFGDQNITTIVLQVPLSDFAPTGKLTVWSETRRFGGNL